MATFAAAALSTVASAVGSVTGAIGTAGAAIGGAAAGAGGLGGIGGLGLSLISGGLTVASALGMARAGEANANAALIPGLYNSTANLVSAYGDAAAARIAGEGEALNLRLSADDATTEIGVERVQGLERRNSLRRALLEVIGERDVAAAASGVDLSFGTPAIAREQAAKDTERALTIDRQTEDFRVARLKERSKSYRLLSRNARKGGLLRASQLEAAGDFASGGISAGALAASSAARQEGYAGADARLAGGFLDALRRG